jgi:AraC family transcriptional regulator, arabinose operon regulatory protein
MLVLPRPRVREFLQQGGTARLVVTDCGYFPRAKSHGRNRAVPIGQAVVMVCVDGKGWCETPAGRFEVEAGQAIVLPPGHPHTYGADATEPWTLWWMHAVGPELPDFLAAAGMGIEAPVRRPSNLYLLVSLLTEVVQWMERDSTTQSLLAAAGAAWHAFSLLAVDIATSDSTTELIDQSAEYLRTHITEHVSVGDLATMARLSPSHFATLFKRRIGYPVLQYQTQVRHRGTGVVHRGGCRLSGCLLLLPAVQERARRDAPRVPLPAQGMTGLHGFVQIVRTILLCERTTPALA